MSGPSRSLPRVLSGSSRTAFQSQSRSSSSTSTPPLRAALLLSRPPLLTPTPTPLESTYHAYNARLRSALSNPVPTSFYFKPGSLPLRRFQRSQHASDVEAFGPRLAGKEPDVGDLPAELEVEVMERDHWVKADSERGERSLERMPEDEVYCLVQREGRWEFPRTEVKKGEALDEAVKRGLVGVDGEMGGRGMNSWVVTKKPVGVVRQGEDRGGASSWDAVKGMFGVEAETKQEEA
ncbi:uncharacterized protein MKK02DRAFT_43765 [Dioszegia hungarica]|uniref:Large ribosomal subunit protein mL46 N-terminal domain-containing protein n=1 Tax=Dioszegia hungarica TaxID=4972 RepID=A0AA38LTQ1_9TREE|nr:uncharacterized protein MKK02DRAFT_43765 [Dioszegia hungarica]KAI9635085.1 hypothetical protein MKK02DRAFT_43765 [Dioszegia hungarica]